jgi:methylated-DNA-protein-cysteine methyltransferase related protein
MIQGEGSFFGINRNRLSCLEVLMPVKYSSPRDPSIFNNLVWEIVRQIPEGRVTTYGQIAAMIPPPGEMDPRSYLAFGARWVGGAMAACPEGVPWQRVINAQGKISLGRGDAKLVQRGLLEAEGVQFDERERVNLVRFGWAGPPESWLRERGLLPPPGFSKPSQVEMDL